MPGFPPVPDVHDHDVDRKPAHTHDRLFHRGGPPPRTVRRSAPQSPAVNLIRDRLHPLALVTLLLACSLTGPGNAQPATGAIQPVLSISRPTDSVSASGAGASMTATAFPAVSAASLPAMIDVGAANPALIVDLRYATPDNFMKRPLYPDAVGRLHPEAAQGLKKACDLAQAEGLRLKLWDAFRPLSVQKEMWELIHDPNYVADPAKGSIHNRGGAVDVTLVASSGTDLDMGTAFADFSPRAAFNFTDIPGPAKANRRRLRDIMEKAGFKPLASEWWHFEFIGSDKWPLRDL